MTASVPSAGASGPGRTAARSGRPRAGRSRRGRTRPRSASMGEEADQREVHAGGTGAAGVVDECTLARHLVLRVARVLAGGPDPADGQSDPLAVREGVVEGHGDRAALEVRRQVLDLRAGAEADARGRGALGGDGGAARLGGTALARPRRCAARRDGHEAGQQQRPCGSVEDGSSHRESLQRTAATKRMVRAVVGEVKHRPPVSPSMTPMRPPRAPFSPWSPTAVSRRARASCRTGPRGCPAARRRGRCRGPGASGRPASRARRSRGCRVRRRT